MAKTMPRSKAAEKLLKTMPEEEDPTTQAPPEAPMDASGGLDQVPEAAGGPESAPQMPPPDAGMPPGGPEEAQEPQDIDSALSGVEAAIQGFSEDAAREIRTHIEAIKEIASKQGGEEGAELAGGLQDPNAPPPDMPSSADIGDAMGMDEKR